MFGRSAERKVTLTCRSTKLLHTQPPTQHEPVARTCPGHRAPTHTECTQATGTQRGDHAHAQQQVPKAATMNARPHSA
eukprot:11201816-Lingulodinium_polyedra.AAC.1